MKAEWINKELNKIADVKMGQSPPSSSYNEIGDGRPFLQGKAEFGSIFPENTKWTTNPKKVSEKGDILFSVRAPIGNVNFADKAYCIGRGLVAIKSLEDADQRFLYYSLIFYKSDLEALGTGSTFKAISSTNLKNFKIPLPPLPEQKQIAHILSTIQEAKAKTEGVIEAAQELKKSMMKHLFTYGPVSVSETDEVELEETEAGKFPKNWEKKYLEEIMEFSRKPTGLKLDKKDKIPFIPMDSIPPNKTKVNWHEKEFGEISTGTYVEKGDLIIGKITPCFENGKQSLLNDLPTNFGYATTEVWAVHPKEKALDLEILDEYLRLPGIRSELAQKMEGATGRQRLPKHVLKNILLPVPSSDEQKEMKKIISSIDQKIEAEQAKKEAIDNLFQSALQQLMTGQLQVDNLKEAV